jgi:hypothetical protein
MTNTTNTTRPTTHNKTLDADEALPVLDGAPQLEQ